MALSTGKKITRYNWDEIPTPNAVIDRVNKLGRDQPGQLTFTDRHGNLIGDNETPGVVPEYPPTLTDEEQDKDNYVEIPGVEDDVGIPGVDAGTEQGTQDPQILEIDDPNNVQVDPPHIKQDTNVFPDNDPFVLQDEATAIPPAPAAVPVAPPEPAPADKHPV
jgi:hypothetical protein